MDAGETSVVALLTKIHPTETEYVKELEKLNIELTWQVNEKKTNKEQSKADRKGKAV